MIQTSLVVVDIETTDSSPEACSLASIGAVNFDVPSQIFYIENRLEYKAKVNPDALNVNGFTYEELIDQTKPDVILALKQFDDWSTVNDRWVLASWSDFDYNVLKHKCVRYNVNWRYGWNKFDIRPVVVAKYISTGTELPVGHTVRLEEALEFCGLPHRTEVHNGLRDAKLEAEVLYRCIFGKTLLLEHEQYPVPKILLDWSGTGA